MYVCMEVCTVCMYLYMYVCKCGYVHENLVPKEIRDIRSPLPDLLKFLIFNDVLMCTGEGNIWAYIYECRCPRRTEKILCSYRQL